VIGLQEDNIFWVYNKYYLRELCVYV